MLAAITADVEAVYVGPLLRLSSAEFQRLITGLIERRLPSSSFFGKSDVELGLLLGVGPALQIDRLARRVALNARRILLGEAAAALPVAFARQEGLVLNMRTARAIGFSPSWQLLTRAELLYDEPEADGPPLSLAGALREAIELNLGVRLAHADVASGKENIREARSRPSCWPHRPRTSSVSPRRSCSAAPDGRLRGRNCSPTPPLAPYSFSPRCAVSPYRRARLTEAGRQRRRTALRSEPHQALDRSRLLGRESQTRFDGSLNPV